jgi:hypothetical protein
MLGGVGGDQSGKLTAPIPISAPPREAKKGGFQTCPYIFVP